MTLLQLALVLLTYFGLVTLGFIVHALLRLRQARRQTGDPRTFVLTPYPRRSHRVILASPPIVLIVMWLLGLGRV